MLRGWRQAYRASRAERHSHVFAAVAGAYRIPDRGRLVPGAWVDLMLFDAKTVGRGAKRRVHDLPTDASRIDTPAPRLTLWPINYIYSIKNLALRPQPAARWRGFNDRFTDL